MTMPVVYDYTPQKKPLYFRKAAIVEGTGEMPNFLEDMRFLKELACAV
jgi:hypothetical protein